MLTAARVALGAAILLPPAWDCFAGHAHAASRTDSAARDDQSDRIADQEDAINAAQDAAQDQQAAGQPAPTAPKAFNVRVSAPLYYNSNPNLVRTGGPAALEGDPEIELSWNQRLASVPLRLNVRLRADTDRYANVSAADEDEVAGSIKIAYYDVNDDQAWAPFVSFRSTGIFDPTFSPWTETRNDFSFGVDKVFNFDDGLHLLPAAARSRVSAIWSLGLSVYLQRRQRTPSPSSTAAYVVPSVAYAPNKEWTMSLFLNMRDRWWDTVASSTTTTTSRRDFDVEPVVTIAYNPPGALFGSLARQQLFGSPQIALQISFENRSSNIASKSWSQWAVGPVLTANWRF
jgi:hypothetical protein